MAARDRIDGAAGLVAVIGESEKLANLVQGKAEIARAPDEGQPQQLVGPIGAILATRPRGRRQQTRGFILADGFDLGVGRARQLSDFHRLTL